MTTAAAAQPAPSRPLPRPVRLVTCSTAPNPRRVNVFLAEKGLDLPRQEIDIATRAHYAPEHLARFGSHHLPALELDDGTTLTETVAICRYLEALAPEPNLMGRDGLEAAKIEQWMRRIEFQVAMPLFYVFRHTHPAMATLETQVPALADAHRPRLADGLALLNRRLEASAYVAGDRFTLADTLAYTTLDFARVAKVRPDDDHVGTLRWMAELAARPSFARPSHARPAKA